MATGGIGGGSEIAVSSLVNEGSKQIVGGAVRVGAGAVAGTAAKAIEEVSIHLAMKSIDLKFFILISKIKLD